MDYDFFGEESGTQKTPMKERERVPAPSEFDKKPQKSRKKIRWGAALLAVGIALVGFGGGFLCRWLTIDKEMRTLITVKNKIQKNYYQEITDEQFYKAVFGGINEDLLDAYSQYMTPEEFAEVTKDMGGNRSGIGLVFSGVEEGLRILRVCGNSPAEAAGILAGERILSCGETKENMTACVKFDAFSTELAKFAEDESFYLEVLSQKGETRVVSLSKQVYVENQTFYRTKDSAYAFTGEKAEVLTEKGAPLTCLPDDTAYIRLVQFIGNAAKEFDEVMAQFKRDGKKNLVLDLRGNGGGYLDIMQSISSYFCKTASEKKPVVAIADYGEKRETYRAYGNYYGEYFSADSRICVLADGDSASASECLIGSMVDYGAISYADICLIERGGVAKTFGKGIMQETHLVNLLERDALKLTTAEIRWPKSNHSIHGRGVLPSDGTKTCPENDDFELETEEAVNLLFP